MLMCKVLVKYRTEFVKVCAMLDVSIIIVNWNVLQLLAACLESIQRSPNPPSLEIIVVDSASSDESVAMLKQRFPDVITLAQTENIGFTRGNNLGMKSARGRYLFLLNPDTEIIDDALTQMVDYLDMHTQVGILGPHTYNTDRTTQSTRRRFPSLAVGIFESTWLQPFAPKQLLDHFYVNDAPENATLEVDWVQGSALIARREVYEQIGGLDEGYIMFSEELDWCKRAKDANWRVIYYGDAHIIHHGGKSTEQVVARKHIHFQESKLRYFRKHHGATTAHFLRVILLVNYGVQLAIEVAKSTIGHKRDMRRPRIEAYWQVLRSGLKVT
jgi:N-acetylglucosaminyl-diphospho-decaprenol L-rhamnosyltransferase